MIYFIPTVIFVIIELYLLVSWLRYPKKAEKKAMMLCFWGFLLGQIYIQWELFLVGQIGQPLPGSTEQNMFMLRIGLGGFLGGLFTIIGLFYASFAAFGILKRDEQNYD